MASSRTSVALGLAGAGLYAGSAFLSLGQQTSPLASEISDQAAVQLSSLSSAGAITTVPSRSASTAAPVFVAVAACGVLAAARRSAPGKTTSRRLVGVAAFENELGVQDPVGFWDPAGFTADGDLLSFKRRRCVELKHGRICMLATMGYITPEVAGKFPGYLSPSVGMKFSDIPNGLAAVSKIPSLGWAQIVAYAGYCELSGPSTRAANTSDYANIAPGDYGFKVLTSSDPAALTKKLNAEIANGRLAMMATMGMFFQDGLTGSAWGDWALYTESPLRAFENELGVQAPYGFWDPLDLAADGNKETFLRRRAVEIKHGRVSMYACIGYIVPESIGKFPGYLSPSQGIKFSDVPNGLGALSKVPVAGWAQILLFCGLIENTGFFQGRQNIGIMKDASMTNGLGPGNYGLGWLGAFNKLKPEPKLRTRKLNSEIANGRLAMFAIMGLLFQNGTFGTTGPEMWFVTFPEYGNTVGDFIPKNLA